MAYQVLNGARILRYLETGELGSKAEGAAWLERNDPDPDVHALLEAALTYQRGNAPDPPDARLVEAFMDQVEAALRVAGWPSRPATWSRVRKRQFLLPYGPL